MHIITNTYDYEIHVYCHLPHHIKAFTYTILVLSIMISNSFLNFTDYLLLAELSTIGLTIYYHSNISNMNNDGYKSIATTIAPALHMLTDKLSS